MTVLHNLLLRDVGGSLDELRKPAGGPQPGHRLPGFTLRAPTEGSQLVQSTLRLSIPLDIYIYLDIYVYHIVIYTI